MTGLVLLAAGASTRLGKPKQELLYQGKTLLQRAARTAIDAGCEPIVVVLGANTDKLSAEIPDAGVIKVHNPEWQEGMASSIRCGLSKLVFIEPHVSEVIFMVCDQPFVDALLLKKLIQTKFESSKGIVASAYKDTFGTPVLFHKTYFPNLLALKGQEGAKKILFRYPDAVAAVPFPQGAVDIDTAADYDFLIGIKSED